LLSKEKYIDVDIWLLSKEKYIEVDICLLRQEKYIDVDIWLLRQEKYIEVENYVCLELLYFHLSCVNTNTDTNICYGSVAAGTVGFWCFTSVQQDFH
jgi:hypothetical protein